MNTYLVTTTYGKPKDPAVSVPLMLSFYNFSPTLVPPFDYLTYTQKTAPLPSKTLRDCFLCADSPIRIKRRC